MEVFIDPNTHTIKAIEEKGRAGFHLTSYPAHRPLPDDAPQEVKELAAQHWTAEVIAKRKAKYGIQ